MRSESSERSTKKGKRQPSSNISDNEEMQRQQMLDEAKREKDRLLLKQRLKDERKRKEMERKKLERDRKFMKDNPVGAKKKKTVTIIDYRSPTVEGDSSSISSEGSERLPRRKK